MPASGSIKKPFIIWIFTDNKPGHRNQLQGLLNAIEEKRTAISHWININDPEFSLFGILNALRQNKTEINITMGAGHSTHKYLLLTRLLTQAKCVALMKPSLPISWFDLLFIPEHDGHFKANNVVSTQGVINKIQPAPNQDPDMGLFLIGGPSKHHAWDSKNIALQIESIVKSQPKIHWHLTTSRRTPDNFIDHLHFLSESVSVITHLETNSDWLPQKLSASAQVWVTADSVSMIYEALTAGAQVGLLVVPGKKTGRLQHGIKTLLTNNTLVDFNSWKKTQKFPAAKIKLNEAARCAEILLTRIAHVD